MTRGQSGSDEERHTAKPTPALERAKTPRAKNELDAMEKTNHHAPPQERHHQVRRQLTHGNSPHATTGGPKRGEEKLEIHRSASSTLTKEPSLGSQTPRYVGDENQGTVSDDSRAADSRNSPRTGVKCSGQRSLNIWRQRHNGSEDHPQAPPHRHGLSRSVTGTAGSGFGAVVEGVPP